MKYIDADKLKGEIERRIKLHDSLASNAESEMIANLEIGAAQALDDLRSILSTLESEKPINLVERIGSYNIVPYIDDKIAKLQDMWREEKVSFNWDDLKDMIEDIARHFCDTGQRSRTKISDNSLDEEIAGMYRALFGTDIINRKEMLYLDTFDAIARHFAKWGADHTPLPEDTVLFNKGVEEGKRLMMEEISECFAQLKQVQSESINMSAVREQLAYNRGASDERYKMRKKMMKEAVEGTVYGNGDYTWVAGDIPSQFKYGDKVRVIVLPKEN